MNLGSRDRTEWSRPPLLLSSLVCLLVVLAMGYLKLHVYADRTIPLAYGMALLVCLWARSRRLLWGMAAAFSVISIIKVFVITPDDLHRENYYPFVACGMMLVNIVVVACVIHGWMNSRSRLESRNVALAAANGALEEANKVLSAHEHEIGSQNDELRAQAEEMEQQTEELQQQTEEMEQQSQELNETNDELTRRERALHTLLESARWLSSDLEERDLMGRICDAALQVMEGEACSAAVLARNGDEVKIRGHYGFGSETLKSSDWTFERSFAALVMAKGQTAYVEDLSLRPDLEVVRPADGTNIRSILASPLRIDGRIAGVVQVYSREPRQWTDRHFKVIEWLAAHASLVLEAVRFQEELDHRRREAEEGSIRKTHFLAAVSHDVRTPANAINLMAELISRSSRDPALVAKIPQMARDLQSSARSLIELVSDVLDLARFDSGHLDVQKQEFSLCAMIEAEVRQLLPLAAAKGLSLRMDRSDRELWLYTDRMKLARVVGNLIGNAIKFTESGGVTIHCDCLPGGLVEVGVTDTGVGISPEHLAHIFDEFFQLRNPERDRSKGTGLGLAISSRLASAIGCALSVQSILGQGSTFTLRIPTAMVMDNSKIPSPASAAEPRAWHGAEGPLAGCRILLVEDHDTTRRATAQLLAAEGAIVMQADSGRTANYLLAHESPQVVLLDLMLPDMDGCRVLECIREHRPPMLGCVLAVSGDATAARREQVLGLGADGLMPKPIDIHRLVQTIASTLQRHVSAGPAAPALAHSPTAS